MAASCLPPGSTVTYSSREAPDTAALLKTIPRQLLGAGVSVVRRIGSVDVPMALRIPLSLIPRYDDAANRMVTPGLTVSVTGVVPDTVMLPVTTLYIFQRQPSVVLLLTVVPFSSRIVVGSILSKVF